MAVQDLLKENRVVLAGIVISVAMLTGMYFFLYAPKAQAQEELHTRVQALLAERDANEQLILRVPNPDHAIEELQQRIQRLKEQVSSKVEIPRIIQQLAGKADEFDVDIVSIKPRDDLKAAVSDLPDGVSKVFIEVLLETPYQSFGDYLASLSDLPMKFTVEDLTLQKPEDAVTNILRVRLIMSTYVLA